MIARFSADRGHAQLISIPRDSWVDIPGHGMNKINASYAFGGPSLLIQTVEQAHPGAHRPLRGHRLRRHHPGDRRPRGRRRRGRGDDHERPVHVPGRASTTSTATQARWYLGQRYGLPGGDFDRVRRQQQYLQADVRQAVQLPTRSPTPAGSTPPCSRSPAPSSIDDTLGNGDLLSLAYSMRNVTPDERRLLHRAGAGHRHGGSGQRRLPRHRDRRADVELPAQRLARRRTPPSSPTRRCPTSLAEDRLPAEGLVLSTRCGGHSGAAGHSADGRVSVSRPTRGITESDALLMMGHRPSHRYGRWLTANLPADKVHAHLQCVQRIAPTFMQGNWE